MAGAYNAREPADPADPGFPPGWPEYPWPFPGQSGYDPDPFFPAPFPPGYEPDYLFAVFGTESIAYDGTASITGTFRDHTSYATNEPDVIVWTATISSSPARDVKLRFSGDEDYADSISSVCVFGTYWGATPDIEFELTEEDNGGTVILTGKSAISDSYLATTLAIEVGVTTVTIEFVSDTATNIQWGAAIEIIGQESGSDAMGRVGLEWIEADVETEDEISVEKTTTTMTIQVDLLREEIYDVAVGYANLSPNTINMSWTATVNFIGEDPTETVKSEAVASMDYFNVFPSLDTVWITIDGTDGTVTVINP